MISVSSEFLSTAVASDQIAVTVAEVWSEPTATSQPALLATLGTVQSGGNWTEDESQQIRRTCSLTIVSQGLSYDDLVPTKTGGLLNPLERNELRLFRGFLYSNGDTETAAGGVYRMSKPVVTRSDSGITIQLTGNDRSAQVSRASWRVPYVIPSGANIDAAVHQAITSRFPGLTFDLVSSDFLLPAISFGTQLGQGQNDPYADITSLATSGGYELFFDAYGVLTMRVIPDPATSPVNLTLDEGPDSVLTQIARTLDETNTYNGVIAISTATGLAAPIRAEVWVSDPTSNIYPPEYGYYPFFYSSPLLTTQAQAISAATLQLQKLLTDLDETSFSCVPNPALTAGDMVALTSDPVGINGRYAASSIVTPADPGTAMQVTCRSTRYVSPPSGGSPF